MRLSSPITGGRQADIGSPPMRVDVIDTLDAFQDLKNNWDYVYDNDPEAQFFLSWTWLRGWLSLANRNWFILAARFDPETSDFVAFFPLRRRATSNNGEGDLDEIMMAGNRLADYTGFICMPEHEEAAISAFAMYLQNMKWLAISLESIHASNDRLQIFLKHFSHRHFSLTSFEQINRRDNINNCICPYLNLPSDWDAYLNMALGTNTRQKVRRYLRKVDNSSDISISHATEETIRRDIDMLLRFWSQKWASRKGDKLPSMIRMLRVMLMHCFRNRSLFLPLLWNGDDLLGAIAILVDERKRSFLFFIAGRDENIKNPPPGFVLHAYSIRYAISHGFKTYDFLRGNESYKYVFGAEELRIRRIIVSSKRQ